MLGKSTVYFYFNYCQNSTQCTYVFVTVLITSLKQLLDFISVGSLFLWTLI